IVTISSVEYPAVPFFPGPGIGFSMTIFHPLHQDLDVRVDILVDISFVPSLKSAYPFQDRMCCFFNFWLEGTYAMGSKLPADGLDVPVRVFETTGCRVK